MRKIMSSEKGRVSLRLPDPLIDWLEQRRLKHGYTLSEEIRHVLCEHKSGEELLLSPIVLKK